MKPRELARDPSKIAEYLEGRIRLVEEASKRLEDVLAQSNCLFGYVPDQVSEEICLSFLVWEGDGRLFEEASNIIHRRRMRRLQREGKIDDGSSWELQGAEKEQSDKCDEALLRFCGASSSYSQRVWASNVLYPSVKTGLVARLRREKRLLGVIDDLELNCLAVKLGVKWDESQMPEKENESPRDRLERGREWRRKKSANFRMELSSKITGPSHQVRSRWCQKKDKKVPVHYQWKLEREGKTHIVQMTIPSDDRRLARIQLKTRGKNDWLVGDMIFLGGSPREWKQTPEGPQIKLVAARSMPTSGVFMIFDFQSDRALEPL